MGGREVIRLALALAAGLAGAAFSAAAPKPREKAATCLFARADRGVRILLRTAPGSPEERSALAPLAAPAAACGAQPGPAVDAAGAAFRASLVRAFVAKRLTVLSAGPNSNPDFSPNAFAVERGYDEAGEMQRPYRLADCVVTIDLDGAGRLLRAAVGSSAEREALAAVMPSLGSCVDRGTQFAIGPEVVRDSIDIVIFRRLQPLLDPLLPAPPRR